MKVKSIVVAGACLLAGAQVAHGVTKAEYLDLMEAAVSAYSDDHIERYIKEVEKDGVQEHGFPRLAANIGVLLANGRLAGKRDTFRRMMSISCRDAAQGPMKLEGNEFSVKELSLVRLTVRGLSMMPSVQPVKWQPVIGEASI